jgi:hypothetical protein
MSTNEQKTQEAAAEEAIVVETPSSQALALITKAEIDVQISTAKAYPRSITKFVRKVLSMATISSEVAESCHYALPRGGKFVEGPSVRLAEIVAASYGNLRTGARIVFTDTKKTVAQGVAHDLEENYFSSQEVERSILQHVWETDPATGKRRKTGRMETMTEDMIVVTGRAACSIAIRNAIFKVVPMALLKEVEDKIKEVAKGTAETLPSRRTKRIDYLHGLGVKDPQICFALGVKEINDIDLDKLQILQGMINALREGVELETIFPADTAKGKADGASKSAEEKLKKKADQKKRTPQEELEDKLKEKEGDKAADQT